NTERHPIAILNFELPYERVDVNVHPTKLMIRIEKVERVCNDITDILRKQLETANLVPKIEPSRIVQQNLKTKPAELPSTDIREILRQKTNVMQKLQEIKNRPIDAQQSRQKELIEKKKEQKKLVEGEEVKIDPIKLDFVAYNIIGKIHKTYILVETVEGLRVIDQHAAHERILFEKIMDNFENKKTIRKQTLLDPIQIEVDPNETLLIKDNLKKLDDFGFMLEEFGRNTFLIRTLPAILGRQQKQGLFDDILAELKKNQYSKVKGITEERFARMACRQAVKAGDNMGQIEMEYLVKNLLDCKQPHTCPHGRPTMIDFTITDLEKSFNRIRGFETNA
ncbi:hypothetical protein KY336_02280, partial [Candidatus Woesearchaeota archaeon]|nr:hypothetical protein [Candidatus Woesearchaeota archaeon]